MTANEENSRVRGGGWAHALLITLAVAMVAAGLAVIAARRDALPAAAEAAAAAAGPARPTRAIEVPPSAPTTTTRPAATTKTKTVARPAPARPQAAPLVATPDDLDVRAATSARTARERPWSLGPYEGVGVWLDVYDWTNALTGGHPQVRFEDIDRMAKLGIQTIYIQTAHRRSPSNVIEGDRLVPLIDRAHRRGMAVVAWYLPTLEDVNLDLRRLVAATKLPVDGLAVDIESLAVPDPTRRNLRLLDLSKRLRAAVGERAIGAITPSAVHLQVVNPNFWPAFPWRQLGNTYDVMLPMSYWSVRRPEWHSGERYIGSDIDRIRLSTGKLDIPIHAIGG
ncbi:MAG: hypothetical protein ACJ739_06135, partial [Acidimicrobiales bacterium]